MASMIPRILDPNTPNDGEKHFSLGWGMIPVLQIGLSSES